MLVHRSAMGKSGICPSCGGRVRITASNSRPAGSAGRYIRGATGVPARVNAPSNPSVPTEEAKRKFGEGVDLYLTGRYGQALAIFVSLAKEYPSDPDIASARQRCLQGLKHSSPPVLEHKPQKEETEFDAAALDEKMLRSFVLKKMLHGETESERLGAAELAARILGLIEDVPAEDDKGSAPRKGRGQGTTIPWRSREEVVGAYEP